MCSRRLGAAAAASILLQNLERQTFFREAERKKETERKKVTESGKDNEKVRKIKRERER